MPATILEGTGADRARLADLIEQGQKKPRVHENKRAFIDRGPGSRNDREYYVCAIGFALVAKLGDGKAAYNTYLQAIRDHKDDGLSALAELLAIPRPLLKEVNELHFSGIRAVEIIAALRA